MSYGKSCDKIDNILIRLPFTSLTIYMQWAKSKQIRYKNIFETFSILYINKLLEVVL